MTINRRTALITGAGGEGMGRSIALTLARDGADIVLNYHKSDEHIDRTAAAIEAMGRRVLKHQADITDPAPVDDMIRAATAAFGRVDIVVCSAGGPWKPQDVTEIAPDHLRSILALEVESVYSLLRATLPGMRARKWGRIVMIGGHMADAWRFGPPDAPLDYPLGKASRHWIARTLGPMELQHGITVNAVAPGPTRRFTHEEALAALEQLPTGDENTPQHIADAVAAFCAESAARTTGTILNLPGHKPV